MSFVHDVLVLIPKGRETLIKFKKIVVNSNVFDLVFFLNILFKELLFIQLVGWLVFWF